MDLTYSIQHYDKEYQQLCHQHAILYSHDYLFSLLQCFHTATIGTLSTNMFLKPISSLLIRIFYFSKTLHRRRRKCINRWRKRRMISCNTTDLSFSPFTNTRIELIIQSKKYTFQPNELYRLIVSSLLHAYDFIVTPIPIKNPYTGIPFSHNCLYLIYLQIPSTPLFYYYTKVHFSLHQLVLQYESLLVSHLIEKTVYDYNSIKLKKKCTDAIQNFTIINVVTCKFEQITTIDKIKESLFRPILLHYYRYLYSINPYQRDMEYSLLIKLLLSLR
jgi:hypothetical protein